MVGVRRMEVVDLFKNDRMRFALAFRVNGGAWGILSNIGVVVANA